MNKRVTVEARAYKNSTGMALLITSQRTDNTVILSEKYFDHIVELMWVRTYTEMEIQKSPFIPVLIAFSRDDLVNFWKLFKQQQRQRRKGLPKGTR